jgi:hypothetical protein
MGKPFLKRFADAFFRYQSNSAALWRPFDLTALRMAQTGSPN